MADRPAARAERHDIEALQRDALARHVAPAAERGLALLHQRDVGGGAADVEGDEILPQPARRQRHARGDTARRARQRRAGGQPRRFLDRRHAAMRQNDEDRPAIARLVQPPAQTREIARHDRPDIGVHARGRDALVLLDLRQHLGRGGDEHIGQRRTHRLGGRALMRIVALGMQEADRHGLHALGGQRGDGGIERGAIERHLDTPIGAQPLAHRQAQPPRHQRGRRRAGAGCSARA